MYVLLSFYSQWFGNIVVGLHIYRPTRLHLPRFSNRDISRLSQGSPNSGWGPCTFCQISSSYMLETKGTINKMCLNHPETTPSPPPTWKKLSSMKHVPSAKTFGDCWLMDGGTYTSEWGPGVMPHCMLWAVGGTGCPSDVVGSLVTRESSRRSCFLTACLIRTITSQVSQAALVVKNPPAPSMMYGKINKIL